ncbi:hypothetical protein MHU86_19175 [Fragilaria crotonensis]|nr:hypothetical protein MHU86_19175 [Fragilaria crotonensis]
MNAKSNNVVKKGRCTGASTYKLKLSPENGKVEVEFEVDQNKNGVYWAVKFFRNNVQFASSTYTTAAPSGSFSADQLSSFQGCCHASGRNVQCVRGCQLLSTKL